MPQKTYKLFQDAGFEGQIGTTNIRVIRGALEGWIANVDIPYGRVVVRSAAGSKLLELPAATPAVKLVPVGIAIATDMYGGTIPQMIEGTNTPGYPKGQPVNILTMGDFVGYVEEAVDAGDNLLFRHAAAGALTALGRFAKTAAAELTAYANAKTLESRSSAGEVWMSLNLP